MVGKFVTSKAGHDKNEVYIIYRELDEYVFLVNGKNRTISHPKCKSKKHIQIINQYVEDELLHKLRNQLTIQEEDVKRAIKLYVGGHTCQKQM